MPRCFRRLRVFSVPVLVTGIALSVAGQGFAEPRSQLAGGFDRPDPAGTPTLVEVGFFVLDISRIGDVDQEFVVDFRLEARWRDPRVVTADEAEDRAGEILALGTVWHPSMVLVNQRRTWTRLPEQLVIQSDGSISYGQRFFGTFAAPLDLRSFPFDEQVLELVVGSNRYGTDEVEIRPFEPLMGSLGRFSVPNWVVGEGRFLATSIGIPSFGKRFAAAIYRVPVERGSVYFIWKVMVPLCLIVAMSWAVFWIDPHELGPQLGLSTAAVLTLVAFQWSLGNLLPRVTYLTVLDHFLIVSTFFVFLALAEAVVSTRIARHDADRARRFDRICRIAVPLGFASALVVVLL